MSRPHSISYTLTRGDDEIELDVRYTAAPYISAVMPSWNDPGSPAEGGEIEDLVVTRGGEAFALTEAEVEQIEAHIHETHDDSDDFDDFDF